jgi:hypothetical protein
MEGRVNYNSGHMVTALMGLILGMVVMYLIMDKVIEPSPESTDIRTDTVLSIRTLPPITVVKTNTQTREVVHRSVLRDTVFRHDTVMIDRTPEGLYCAPPFVAFLDTNVSGNTISARYEYPQSTLSVLFQQKPDSVMTIRTIETITRTQQRPWWMDILTHVGAASLGYVAANTLTK